MHKTSTTVFIDLEQTLIDNWSSRELINIRPIRAFLKARGVTEISIYSFAIYDDNDKRKFSDHLKSQIEEALGVTVLAYPSVRDMIREDKKFTGVTFDQWSEITDYLRLRRKQDSFVNYILGTCEFDLAILIDDVVPDLTISHRFDGWAIELWNVNSLRKAK